MHLTEEQKQILRQAYGDYLAGPADPVMDFDMRDLSAKFELLPMLYDFGYCLAIKLDGQIVAMPWEPPHALEDESDARTIRVILAQGARKYPTLECLVPQRPAEAVDCAKCNGTGRCVPEVPSVYDNFICFCGGLGWLLKTD
ncbi:MAG: hypothetical protein IPI39_03095 [Candidatus Obscuribacter sp.]|nr:hypothetical protein [Candidatus Obscuribacter sp.]MBK9619396.1 hypothetical protein [Candidatus Obscuribacter sp.]